MFQKNRGGGGGIQLMKSFDRYIQRISVLSLSTTFTSYHLHGYTVFVNSTVFFIFVNIQKAKKGHEFD